MPFPRPSSGGFVFTGAHSCGAAPCTPGGVLTDGGALVPAAAAAAAVAAAAAAAPARARAASARTPVTPAC